MNCQNENVITIELTEKLNIDNMINILYNSILFYYNLIQQLNINNIITKYDYKNKVIKMLKNNVNIVEINKKIYYDLKNLYQNNFLEFIFINKPTFFGININYNLSYCKYLYNFSQVIIHDLDNEYNLIDINFDNKINNNYSTYDYLYNNYCEYSNKIKNIYVNVKNKFITNKILNNNIDNSFYNNIIYNYDHTNKNYNTDLNYLMFFNDYVINVHNIIFDRYNYDPNIKYDVKFNLDFLNEYFANKHNIINCINYNYNFIKYIKPYILISDKDIVITIIKQNGLFLEDTINDFKNDYEIVMYAVKNNGLSLKYASNELKNNYYICINAISNNLSAYQYVGDDNKYISDILYLAINLTHNINFIDFNLLEINYVNKIISFNPSVLLFINIDINVIINSLYYFFNNLHFMITNNKNFELSKKNLDDILLFLEYSKCYDKNSEFLSLFINYIPKFIPYIGNDIDNIYTGSNIVVNLYKYYNVSKYIIQPMLSSLTQKIENIKL
jgi:hypothetical protein